MENNVPAERDEYRKSVFYSNIGAEEKRENFKSNMDNQKMLVLTVVRQTNVLLGP